MNSCKLFCLYLALITGGSDGAKLNTDSPAPTTTEPATSAPVTTEPATSAPVTPDSSLDSFDSNFLMDSGSCSLTLLNYTWSFDSSKGDQSVEGLTKENCTKRCLTQSWCRGYTWSKEDSSGSICHMFKQLRKTIACKECSDCVSGKATPISGVCSESWISRKKTDSELSCLELCSKTNGCQFYSYYTGNSLLGLLQKNNCYLYSTCTATSTCEPFQTGKLECFEKLPSQCSNYKTLTSANRKSTAGHARFGDYLSCSGSYNTNSEWQGSSWYRIQGNAGTRVASAWAGTNRCGTCYTGWISGSLPSTPGETVDREACFGRGSTSCYWKKNIKITHCSTFMVYYLVDTVGCDVGYCTE